MSQVLPNIWEAEKLAMLVVILGPVEQEPLQEPHIFSFGAQRPG
jgi:hypothetical protein